MCVQCSITFKLGEMRNNLNDQWQWNDWIMPHLYYKIFRWKSIYIKAPPPKKIILLVKKAMDHIIHQKSKLLSSIYHQTDIPKTPLYGSRLPTSLSSPLIHRKTYHLSFSPTTSVIIPEDFIISILSQFLHLLLKNLFFHCTSVTHSHAHTLNLVTSNN